MSKESERNFRKLGMFIAFQNCSVTLAVCLNIKAGSVYIQTGVRVLAYQYGGHPRRIALSNRKHKATCIIMLL